MAIENRPSWDDASEDDITDTGSFISEDSTLGDDRPGDMDLSRDEEVIMRPDRTILPLSASRWTESGYRSRHQGRQQQQQHGDDERRERSEGRPPTPSHTGFLRPLSLMQALELTDQCVIVTEVFFPFVVVHANAAFTRLVSYHFHEVARRPFFFLQGPGTDLVAVHALLEEVMATGFGRGSLVHYTRDAQPFVDHCSIEPIVNSAYRIPRITHLMWTLRPTPIGNPRCGPGPGVEALDRDHATVAVTTKDGSDKETIHESDSESPCGATRSPPATPTTTPPSPCRKRCATPATAPPEKQRRSVAVAVAVDESQHDCSGGDSCVGRHGKKRGFACMSCVDDKENCRPRMRVMGEGERGGSTPYVLDVDTRQEWERVKAATHGVVHRVLSKPWREMVPVACA